MLHDARALPSQTELRADLCVAGGGAAGITLALDLARAGHRVALFESGGESIDSDNQALNDGEMTGLGGWTLAGKRIRALGGATGHWAGWCRPMHKRDFEARSWIPDSGWPISREDLDPYYARAHRALGLGPFDFTPGRFARAAGATLLTPTDSQIETRIWQRTPITNLAKLHAAALRETPGLDVYLHANLTDIRLDANGDRVERFDLRTLEGKAFTARGHHFVVAMGGIENARMLLAARQQNPGGVANSSGTVGRYFMEHPHYYLSLAMLLPRFRELDFYSSFPDVNVANGDQTLPTQVIAGLGLKRERIEQGALLDFNLSFRDEDEPPFETGSLSAPSLLSLAADGVDRPRYVRTILRAEQTPNPDSRLTLGDQRDALGTPRARLRWVLDPKDTQNLVQGLEAFAVELGRAQLGHVWHAFETGAVRIDGGGHHMGTTRMGDDPKTSVVDGDCACHDHHNLHIAGSSVFRSAGAANPTLTLIALAHRLADRLSQRLKGGQ